MNDVSYKEALSLLGFGPRVVLYGRTTYFCLNINGSDLFATSYIGLYEYILKHNLNHLKLF